MTIFIKRNGIKYRVSTVHNPDWICNYDTMVHVYEVGGKLPISGWSIKSDTHAQEIRKQAINFIRQRYEQCV